MKIDTGGDPPDRLDTDAFTLVPLRTHHAELDHAALMASAGMLRVWSGSDWPAPGFTVADNEDDLARHQEEHDAGDAFTYTVLSPDGERCLGCVYVEPPARWVDETPGTPAGDAVVGLWVVADRVGDGLELRLFAAVHRWLRDMWGMADPWFRAHEDDVRQRGMFEQAGLTARDLVEVPGRRGRFVVYSA